MASFARINDDWIVEQVIAVDNALLLDDQGHESEALGVQFCQQLYGADTKWVQTSYNGNIRKNFAGIGYSYNNTRDVFIPPRPYVSWVLNEETCLWEPPLSMPDDGVAYEWNEEYKTWQPIQNKEVT